MVLNKVAEQKVEAALAPLRDEEGYLKPILPKHWRFKGKLTWERVNSIYAILEVRGSEKLEIGLEESRAKTCERFMTQ